MITKKEKKVLEAVFLNQIVEELRKARDKFPDNTHRLAALQEECGEVANAMLEVDYGDKGMHDVWKECVQVAVCAMRVACEGDLSFSYHPPFHSELIDQPED